jgi:hypothetical protein
MTQDRYLFAHQQTDIYLPTNRQTFICLPTDRYLLTNHSFIQQQVDIYQQNGTYTICTQQGTPGVNYCMRIGSKGLCIATLIKHDGVTVKAIMLPAQNCD